jgi:hypothetical protein
VLVDVVAVLVVPVAVVQVVLVIAVLDGFATVTGAVRPVVGRVDLRLGVTLVPVHVIAVVTVLDRFAPVVRQVFVIRDLGVRRRHVS